MILTIDLKDFTHIPALSCYNNNVYKYNGDCFTKEFFLLEEVEDDSNSRSYHEVDELGNKVTFIGDAWIKDETLTKIEIEFKRMHV